MTQEYDRSGLLCDLMKMLGDFSLQVDDEPKDLFLLVGGADEILTILEDMVLEENPRVVGYLTQQELEERKENIIRYRLNNSIG